MQIIASGWQCWAEQWFSCHQHRIWNVHCKGSLLWWEGHSQHNRFSDQRPVSPSCISYFRPLRTGDICGRAESSKAVLACLFCIDGTVLPVWKWTEMRHICLSPQTSPSICRIVSFNFFLSLDFFFWGGTNLYTIMC